ncbi:hypothetical protein AB1Y20_004004 [Prymnesium parvum]|uniref:NADP-dependent oxidoreductase domain-containing protein n=1 Tax=Prymnesium parvum TaxID=97485 RepID=A0AB34J866_PRYPA
MLLLCLVSPAFPFPLSSSCQPSARSAARTSPSRRGALSGAGAMAMCGSGLGGFFPPFFAKAAEAALGPQKATGATNEVVRVVDKIRQKRLGGSDLVVSEMGLGTQRWGSTDFNAPDEALCHKMMDRAILESGVNLIDTAEQYPIPSDRARPEGSTERIIGSWLSQAPSRRDKVVLASKITGGRNVNARTICADLEGSLRRLRTDRLDVYLLHWPARYTPQANWGQSLEYKRGMEAFLPAAASFEEIAGAMGALIEEGKLRGWGMCNDNAYGLTASAYAARAQGLPPPCVMQNDYSLLNRRIDENGVSEASSPLHENVGFMAYNILAGGVLTGKYLGSPAAVDDADEASARRKMAAPRGRMDEVGWGRTLYRYRSEPAEVATRLYAELAAAYGLSLTELSVRWARSRPSVTTSLVGHTSMAQLEEDLKYFRETKPLPEQLLWEIDRVHMRNRLPIFSSTRVGKDWDGEGEIGESIP